MKRPAASVEEQSLKKVSATKTCKRESLNTSTASSSASGSSPETITSATKSKDSSLCRAVDECDVAAHDLSIEMLCSLMGKHACHQSKLPLIVLSESVRNALLGKPLWKWEEEISSASASKGSQSLQAKFKDILDWSTLRLEACVLEKLIGLARSLREIHERPCSGVTPLLEQPRPHMLSVAEMLQLMMPLETRCPTKVKVSEMLGYLDALRSGREVDIINASPEDKLRFYKLEEKVGKFMDHRPKLAAYCDPGYVVMIPAAAPPIPALATIRAHGFGGRFAADPTRAANGAHGAGVVGAAVPGVMQVAGGVAEARACADSLRTHYDDGAGRGGGPTPNGSYHILSFACNPGQTVQFH